MHFSQKNGIKQTTWLQSMNANTTPLLQYPFIQFPCYHLLQRECVAASLLKKEFNDSQIPFVLMPWVDLCAVGDKSEIFSENQLLFFHLRKLSSNQIPKDLGILFWFLSIYITKLSNFVDNAESYETKDMDCHWEKSFNCFFVSAYLDLSGLSKRAFATGG